MAEGHIYFHNARPMHVPKGENIYIFDGAVKSIVYGTPPLPVCSGAKISRNSIDVQAERSTVDTDSLRGTDRFIKMSTGSFSLTQTKQKCPNTSIKDEPDKIKVTIVPLMGS